MPLLLFVAFLIVPLLELAVILQVGAVVGGGWTLFLLVADSVAGALIVRREGRRAWGAFREALEARRWPGNEVVQGGLVLVGGALLLTPGFVTDAVGLACVLPPTRAVIAAVLRTRVSPPPLRVVDLGAERLTDHATRPGTTDGSAPGPARPASASGEIVDVEVVSVERDEPTED